MWHNASWEVPLVDYGSGARRGRRIGVLAQQANQVLEVHQAQQGPASGQGHEGIDGGQIRPSGGEGTDLRGEGGQEKDAGFTPGHPLGQKRKLLPG
jgi:hypothetical protein